MASLALSLLGAAPTLIQGISSLVHGIENIFGKGNGAAKKAAVIQAFQGATQTYDTVASQIPGGKLPTISNEAVTAMGNLVDAIVAFYNATGIFTKSTPVK